MTVAHMKEEYRSYLVGRGFKDGTIVSKFKSLELFGQVLLSLDRTDLRETGEEEFLAYLEYLREKGYAGSTVAQYLSFVRQFFIWLYKNDLILAPVADFVPRFKHVYKERTIFTAQEMSRFLNCIESERDRMIFELLYSSGLRINELLGLRWCDYQGKERKLRIIQGKGSRDRYVPVSQAAAWLLARWKKLIKGKRQDYIFPGMGSGHLSDVCVRSHFHEYLEKAEITRQGLTVHSIRHSMATHLLEAGADVRYVAELLGHRNMETTVRYTHPTEESQKKAYRMYHPRENGYYREIDGDYRKELDKLRERFKAREEYLAKQGKRRC